MVSYHYLKIVIIHFFDDVNEGTLTSLHKSTYKYFVEYDEEEEQYIYTCLMRLNNKYDGSEFFDLDSVRRYKVYDIGAGVKMEKSDYQLCRKLFQYTGIGMTDDEILDEISDELKTGIQLNLFNPQRSIDNEEYFTRKSFLKGMLYFRNEVMGRPVNTFNFHVHEPDEFVHAYDQYIIESEYLSSNSDYSKGIVSISTFLSYRDCLDTFGSWIVREGHNYDYKQSKKYSWNKTIRDKSLHLKIDE